MYKEDDQVSKVVKSEVNSVTNSAMVKALKEDIADARKLKIAIKLFVSTSKLKLTGPNYDQARDMMQQYIPILDRRISIASQLVDSIKSGANQMSNYMGKFAVLDDSLREEYEKNLQRAQSNLNYLDSISWTSGEMNLFNYWNMYFSSKKIIDECQDYLEKLDGLAGVDGAIYSSISAASSTSMM